MEEKQSWDWDTDLKEIPVKEWETKFNWVEEPHVSPDGENVASIVNIDEMAFGVCVNGKTWDGEYEKAWNLRSLPNNTFAACVCNDEEWTLNVNNIEWSNKFDFIWDLQVSCDGKQTSLAFQRDGEYGMAVNDTPWDDVYESISNMVVAPNGASAAVVQVGSMASADVEAFKKGLFSIAVNGRPFDKRFLNIWDIDFDKTGLNLAAGVRLTREEYSIVHNDKTWDQSFQCVWKPLFLNQDNVLAPVRTGGKWRLFKDNEPFWEKGYEQLWRLKLSPANNDIAAIVSNSYGKWTVAVNDVAWNMSCDSMISDIFYSENGACLAAVLKDKGYWTLAVNQKMWELSADKVFTPCISHDGSLVSVVIEKKGQYHLVVNQKVVAGGYDFLAEPVFSPDNSKILLKGIEKGVYKRRIISL